MCHPNNNHEGEYPTLLKSELQHIIRNRGVIWLMVATILIPITYSFFFLTSAWDPYGNTGKVPIAVVNLDEPTKLQGQTVNVGEQTVAKLRKDHQLGWHITSAQEAARGLKNNKYYAVITFPRNFSRDAATVLDKQPQQMHFTYKTNGSLNYISEVMSQVGSDKLNSQIQAKVTQTYAQSFIDQMHGIGKQLGKAADGSTQISDGLGQMKAKTAAMPSGVQQLTAGSGQLASGINQYTDGVGRVADGLGQLHAKTPELAAGVGQLDDGINQYTNGTDQVADGISLLYGNTPALQSGIGQLADGVNQYTGGTDQVADGIQQINANAPQLTGGVQQLTDGINQMYTSVVPESSDNSTLSSGTKALLTGINDLDHYTIQAKLGDDQVNLPDGVATLHNKMTKLLQAISDQNTLISSAFQTFDIGLPVATILTPKGITTSDLGLPAGTDKVYPLIHFEKLQKTATTTADNDLASLKAAVAKSGDADAQAALSKFEASYTGAKDAKDTAYNTTKGYLSFAKNSIQRTDTDAVGDPKGLKVAIQKFADNLETMDNELNHADVSGHPTYASAVSQLKDGLNKLNNAVNVGVAADGSTTTSLTAGVTQLRDGLVKLNNAVNVGVDEQGHQTTSLASAVTQLYDGTQQLHANSAKLRDGAGQLNAAAPTLASGVKQLYDGTQQLKANSGKLRDGADQLNAAVPTLRSGVQQLYDGSQLLNSNSPALKSGASQLAGGLSTLNASLPTLMDGINRLNDGSGQLTTGLKDGALQISQAHLTPLTAKMFANPATDKQIRFTKVANYGAALAPYVLALALFIAIIIFNFGYPMRRRNHRNETVMQFLFSKLAVGTVVAVAMAIIEATLIMLLGLPVAHVGAFYGITILFALAAQYMTMLLNLAFNRVGIFIALGLLTLSGSGGLFPAETINPLFESIQQFLPMTHAINGYRNAITDGISSTTVTTSTVILIVVAILSIALMIPAIGYIIGKDEESDTNDSNAE
ncbi:autotransport protein [Lacticaseibacillus pantheris DSM 15945 = JCM 12539 = NBRC 106106]|uniref:Autotransport protein n=2 Tax=Lacticaseibacillus pantheris TaxID=171523 RepID=A0A0R1UAY0_9LACO|nr:autotransport protein [Lacticaseibacillus pantheris DSM 15945 = JCM 12539 = NBRC 106106]